MKTAGVASSAPLQLAALPSSLRLTRTSLGKSWQSVSLQQLLADLATKKHQLSSRHGQYLGGSFSSDVDSLIDAFMRLNLVDPASQPQSQADLVRVATSIRTQALKSHSQTAVSPKDARKQALLLAINDVQAQIARALLFQDFTLAALLSAILLDLLAQLSAL